MAIKKLATGMYQIDFRDQLGSGIGRVLTR